jgi:hypothetical protein
VEQGVMSVTRKAIVAGAMAVLCSAGAGGVSGNAIERTAWADDAPTWSTNDFIDFQLPAHWVCNDEAPRTCQDSRPGFQQEAMLSLAGKPAKENETLPNFMAYLKRPRNWQDDHGNAVTSHVIEAKMVTFGGQPWASVLHQDGEVRGFKTRYLATVKNGTMVVLTFTARDDKYNAYEPDFEHGVQTAKLKVMKH